MKLIAFFNVIAAIMVVSIVLDLFVKSKTTGKAVDATKGQAWATIICFFANVVTGIMEAFYILLSN